MKRKLRKFNKKLKELVKANPHGLIMYGHPGLGKTKVRPDGGDYLKTIELLKGVLDGNPAYKHIKIISDSYKQSTPINDYAPLGRCLSIKF